MSKLRGLKQIFLTVILAPCISLMMIVTACALSLESKGEIIIQPQYGGKDISVSSSFSIYQVASATSLSPLEFKLTDPFSASGIDVNKIKSASEIRDATDKLVSFVSGAPVITANGGKKVELPLGVYLVLNKSIGGNYQKCSPFLIFIPYITPNGDRTIAFTAHPKVGYVPPGGGGGGGGGYEDNSPNSPNNPNNPGNPSSNIEAIDSPVPLSPGQPTIIPSYIEDPEVPFSAPKAGMLQWPIPVLSALGMIFIYKGVSAFRGKRNDE